MRDATVSHGVDLVINARTDAFLRRAGSPEQQLAGSVDRGRRYLAAGADCVYPIGVADPEVLRALVDAVPGPVNAGYGKGRLAMSELARSGWPA